MNVRNNPAATAARGDTSLFVALVEHRALLARLVSRDLRNRYQGTVFGIAWLLATPLMLMLAYWFVLGIVLQARWGNAPPAHYPLMLFAGLSVYWFVADVVGRAPSLVLEFRGYVKKVMFPLDVLPWMALAVATVQLGVNLSILFVGQWLIAGGVPSTWPFVMLVLLSVVPLLLGATWLLASLGVYLRDLQQVVPLLLTVGMFLSPVFFSLDAVPGMFRQALSLNPLTLPIEQLRAVTVEGRLPDFAALARYFLVAVAVMVAGHAWFRRTQRGFADVV
jgi:lipopolysaccharide transport system permease protein